MLSNPGTLLGLANTAVDNITPSESLADPVRIAQLAYTLRDVPFDDITFAPYPVTDGPEDTNRVVPDEAAAAALWQALADNAPIALTGELGANDGVIADPSAPTAEPTAQPSAAAPAEPDENATPGASAAPGIVELPSNISGSKASQATCSDGNG